MKRTLKQIIAEHRFLKSVLIFLAAYVILSVVWIQIKDAYAYGIFFVASKIVAGVKDARLDLLTRGTDFITASFGSIRAEKSIAVDVPFKISAVTSSVPLTLSMVASFSSLIGNKKRAYVETVLLLLLFHLVYAFFWGTTELTRIFMMRGVEAVSLPRLSLYQFLRGATEYASMSFAPFLIVIYIFMRFRK